MGAIVLRLALGAQLDADSTGAADEVRRALDARDFRRAEALVEGLRGDERPLLEARLRFEVGDFVGCTSVAAAALQSAPANQVRELTWWGAKAALWLQDAAGAQAWTSRLTHASATDAAWEGVARDYAARAAELAAGADDESRALRTSRWTVAIGALFVVALTLVGARRGSPTS
jgi:hypothetical protein